MKQVSHNDPLISSWRFLSSLISLAHLCLNNECETHPCQTFHYAETCRTARHVLEFPCVPDMYLLYTNRAGNVKRTSEYQPKQRAWWTEAAQWTEEVTHGN